MLPVACRVDQHAIPQPGAELRNIAVLHRGRWIDRRAKDSREDHHAAFTGIDAVRVGPFDLFIIGWVDVLFDNDNVLVAVSRGAVAPQGSRDLLRLTLVVFFDLYADVDAVGDRRCVDIEYAGNARGVENVP